MPEFNRVEDDYAVSAICAEQTTRVQTNHGDLVAQEGEWIVYDYLDHPTVMTYDEFMLRFVADGSLSENYLAQHGLAPSILSLSAGTVGEAEDLVITGTHFGSSEETSKVYFGKGELVAGTAVSWSDTEITVTVPEGLPLSSSIFVHVYVGEKFSNAYAVVVTAVE